MVDDVTYFTGTHKKIEPIKPAPKPKYVLTKKQIKEESDIEIIILMSLLILFGCLLMVITCCILIYCYKEQLEARQTKEEKLKKEIFYVK